MDRAYNRECHKDPARKIRFTEIKNVPFEPESQDNSVLSDLEAEDLLKVSACYPMVIARFSTLFVLEGYSHEVSSDDENRKGNQPESIVKSQSDAKRKLILTKSVNNDR
jgi:hypothetical protein